MERDEARLAEIEADAPPTAPGPLDSHDEDDRLKPDYVRRVAEALESGDTDSVYALVEALHPADIADLFELLAEEDRPAFAAAISDLMGGEVLAELNEHVRELLVEALPAGTVADLAGQLETDDAVALIEDLDESEQQAVLAELDPE